MAHQLKQALRYLPCVLILALQAACSSIPDRAGPRPVESAAAPAQAGILAEVATEIGNRSPDGHSGFWLLDQNAEAMNWRLSLTDSA